MEKQKKIKCPLKKHDEIGGINYCMECKVYMCKNA